MARAAPANIRSLARAHTELALRTLTGICSSGKNEGARVSAATEILNRGWGRPVADDADHEGITVTIRKILEGHGPIVDVQAGKKDDRQQPLTIEGTVNKPGEQ
jgi:hypothetical protein